VVEEVEEETYRAIAQEAGSQAVRIVERVVSGGILEGLALIALVAADLVHPQTMAVVADLTRMVETVARISLRHILRLPALRRSITVVEA
jgi:hypothetical protein